jgi:hypothetical protein
VYNFAQPAPEVSLKNGAESKKNLPLKTEGFLISGYRTFFALLAAFPF